MVDLLDHISWQAVECLNEQHDHAVANALKQVRRGSENFHARSHGRNG